MKSRNEPKSRRGLVMVGGLFLFLLLIVIIAGGLLTSLGHTPRPRPLGWALVIGGVVLAALTMNTWAQGLPVLFGIATMNGLAILVSGQAWNAAIPVPRLLAAAIILVMAAAGHATSHAASRLTKTDRLACFAIMACFVAMFVCVMESVEHWEVPVCIALSGSVAVLWLGGLFDTTGTNNGRISTFSDGVTDETLNYQYDALNRLIPASRPDASGRVTELRWVRQRARRDGDGGVAPNYNLVHDYATNRVAAPDSHSIRREHDGDAGQDDDGDAVLRERVGAFLTPDPFKRTEAKESPGNWNQYGYVIGDPVNYFDPMGLQSQAPGVVCFYVMGVLDSCEWVEGGTGTGGVTGTVPSGGFTEANRTGPPDPGAGESGGAGSGAQKTTPLLADCLKAVDQKTAAMETAAFNAYVKEWSQTDVPRALVGGSVVGMISGGFAGSYIGIHLALIEEVSPLVIEWMAPVIGQRAYWDRTVRVPYVSSAKQDLPPLSRHSLAT